MGSIRYFTDDTDFVLRRKLIVKNWLKTIIVEEHRTLGHLNYIFCSDQYLLALNQEYLKKETLTDVIAFPFDSGRMVSGDVYISVERVAENASKFKTEFEFELLRVMVHGLLHLIGFSDKSKSDKEIMRGKENYYLNRFKAA